MHDYSDGMTTYSEFYQITDKKIKKYLIVSKPKKVKTQFVVFRHHYYLCYNRNNSLF